MVSGSDSDESSDEPTPSSGGAAAPPEFAPDPAAIRRQALQLKDTGKMHVDAGNYTKVPQILNILVVVPFPSFGAAVTALFNS